MSTFSNAVINSNNNETTITTNGMKTNVTSNDVILDLFSKLGACRDFYNLENLFFSAYNQNKELTIRTLLWSRDIRGGAGNRQLFRDAIVELEKINPSLVHSILPLIPELGRWDDLFIFNREDTKKLVYQALKEAIESGNSLAAKWAPREHTNRYKSFAKGFKKYLKMTSKEYRKFLVNNTNVVEQKMCAKQWNDIKFEHVPSLASIRYQRAFERNAPEEYSDYKQGLKDGTFKVNTAAVYPHQVFNNMMKQDDITVAEAQWKALPDYINDARILPMIDVSGSMNCSSADTSTTCMAIAVSLGMYMAERNKGNFKDVFLTFSAEPELHKVTGDSLYTKFNSIRRADWGMNTDLQKALRKVLKVGVKNNVPDNEMPEYLVVLSDMQFDFVNGSYGSEIYNPSAVEMIKAEYKANGYTLPKIVFWNLFDGDPYQAVVKRDELNMCEVSGFSPSLMKTVLSADIENFNPLQIMLDVIMDERYNYTKYL